MSLTIRAATEYPNLVLSLVNGKATGIVTLRGSQSSDLRLLEVAAQASTTKSNVRRIVVRADKRYDATVDGTTVVKTASVYTVFVVPDANQAPDFSEPAGREAALLEALHAVTALTGGFPRAGSLVSDQGDNASGGTDILPRALAGIDFPLVDKVYPTVDPATEA